MQPELDSGHARRQADMKRSDPGEDPNWALRFIGRSGAGRIADGALSSDDCFGEF